jgi:hypothetical protein
MSIHPAITWTAEENLCRAVRDSHTVGLIPAHFDQLVTFKRMLLFSSFVEMACVFLGTKMSTGTELSFGHNCPPSLFINLVGGNLFHGDMYFII